MVQMFACLPGGWNLDAESSPTQVAPSPPNGQSHHVQIRASRGQFANHRPRNVCKGTLSGMMCMGEVYLHDMHKGRGKYIFLSSRSEHIKEEKKRKKEKNTHVNN